jgi:polysaccharide biosynthesis transport protein
VSISQVLLILWRRGWIAALTFLTTLLVALGVLYFVPGRYDAVATASIDTTGIDPVNERTGGSSNLAIGLMQGNMLQLVTSQRVAVDVVKRLNLTASPSVQANYRNSASFGRESIENWMASGISKNVEPKFAMGANVLSIKYKSGDPNQAALTANAFLAATVDATIAIEAASGEQTARWFDPQIENTRKELDDARTALEKFQEQTNLVAPQQGADTQSSALMSVSQELEAGRTALSVLQTRLASGDTNLSSDPSDPDLQLVNSLKDKLVEAQTVVETAKIMLGANNPKIVAEAANMASIRKQVTEATERMHEHLKARIAMTENQIANLQVSQAEARKALIASQAQRDRFNELAHDVSFRLEQLNEEERMAAQARLQSKLTFAGMAVLDKAVPPIEPSFPKPMVVIPAAIGAGLTLGLILALLAEMLDRRVRLPMDLAFAASVPLLGVVHASKRSKSLPRKSLRRLQPA